ncbi:MAG: hypothetical protein C4562_05380 [Actinobacteria bacterium]|nr:MAG: hypothetical protein C4562_05380 [Actinomycetota bacterium]
MTEAWMPTTAEKIAAHEETKKQNTNVVNEALPSNALDNNIQKLPYISLASYPLTEMTYLVEDIVPNNCISMFYGDGGQGKSYLALYLAVLAATGKNFLDKGVKKGRALYLDFELSPELQRQRLDKICKGLNISPATLTTNLLYLSPGINGNAPSNLTDLIPVVKQDSFDLIIVDSIGAALTGDPEAAKDICKLFQQLRELGTVLLLDHQAKKQRGEKPGEKTPFGSVYKTNLSRNVWHLNAVPGDDNKLSCLLKHKKSNFSALKEDLGLSLCFGDGLFKVEACEVGLEFFDHKSVKDQILIFLSEANEATAEEIAEAIEADLSTVKPKISLLVKEGKVEKTGKKAGRADIYTNVVNECNTRNVSDNNVQPEDNKPPLQLIKDTFDAEVIPEGVPF